MLPNIVGFVVGSILLGLPFTTITLFGMQEARRLKPRGATVFIGLLTASYGIGQIVGPLVVLAQRMRRASRFRLRLRPAACLSGRCFIWPSGSSTRSPRCEVR